MRERIIINYIRRPLFKDISVGTVFSFIIFSIVFEIGISFSDARESMVYIYDFSFVALWLYLLFNMIGRKKNLVGDHPGEEKTLLFFAGAFAIYFIIAALIKSVNGESINDSTVLLRPLLWPIASYIFLSINKKIAGKIVILCAVFFTLLNVVVIVDMCFFTESIRKITVLGNINTVMNLQLFGAICWYILVCYKKAKDKRRAFIIKSLAAFNTLMAVFTTMGSGTRLFFPLLFCVLLILIAFNKVDIITKLKRAAFLLLSTILMFLALLNINILDSKNNIYRTFGYVNADILNVFNFTEANGGGQGINHETEADETIELSNDMRKTLWTKSLDLISEDLLLGRGDVIVEVKMPDENAESGYRTLQQSPHNFILEVLLSVGVIGLIIYILIMATPLLHAFTSHNSMIAKINIAVIYSAIFIPSIFQPLITTKLILGLGFWLMLIAVKTVTEDNKRIKEENQQTP